METLTLEHLSAYLPNNRYAEAYTKELMNEVAKEVFKQKTLDEIIKEEQSIKLTATHQPHYHRILSGQEKRRERRKKQKPKKNN